MEPETYNKIKGFLEEQELFLTDNEIDIVFKFANDEKINSEHVGIRPQRCNDNPREKAFMEHWLKENRTGRSGPGILQSLFIDSPANFSLSNGKVIIEMTNRDRQIAATVIQWLGSNIGFAFLVESLSDCGYKIVKAENHHE